MHPRNAVIAAIADVAEQYRDAFNLRRVEWDAFSYNAQPFGRRYDRIVMIRPHWRATPAELNEFDTRCHAFRQQNLEVGGIMQIL